MSIADTLVESLDELFLHAATLTDLELMTDIAEIEDTLDELRIEITAMPKEKKEIYCSEIRVFESKLETMKKRALLGDRVKDARGPSASLDALETARAQLAETERIGTSTLAALAEQKETIRNAQSNTRRVNEELGFANKLLNRIRKNEGFGIF